MQPNQQDQSLKLTSENRKIESPNKRWEKKSESDRYAAALERAYRAAQFEEPERWDGLS